LLAGQRGIAHQIRHADNGIQRRSHLVADHRNEAALRLVGGLCARERVEQLRDERANVYAERDEAKQQTITDVGVSAPKIVVPEHESESGNAQAERHQEVALSEAEAV